MIVLHVSVQIVAYYPSLLSHNFDFGSAKNVKV